MDTRSLLKQLEEMGTYWNGDLRIGGQGTYWIDEENGLLYEVRSENPDLSVDFLTDEEMKEISVQEL